jgi:tRNA 2-selenouridine synthase
LFDNGERALVGKLYQMSGRQEAIRKGLEITAPKISGYVDQAVKLARHDRILLHCWRGGMRSESMAWLLKTSGLSPGVLKGGYKKYRKFVHDSFLVGPWMIVIGGMTGAGKTKILDQLAVKGLQVINLEKIANHKGSVFGELGQSPQPTTEQFENDLSAQWNALDTTKPVFIEDESISIGSIFLPMQFFQKISLSTVIVIDRNREDRIKAIIDEYSGFPKDLLKSVILKIQKRLGGLNTMKAIEAVREGDFYLAVDLVLNYYDKAYQHSLEKRDPSKVSHLSLDNNDPAANAESVKDFSKSKELLL